MTKYRKNKFTLVEVIVGMAVLSILMLMLLQFFSGAQKIWSSTESKNQIYADGRVAMNLMANVLQSMYYADDKSMFVYEPATDGDKIYFSTRSAIHPRGNSNFYFASFQRKTTTTPSRKDELIFCIYCDENANGTTNKNFWTNIDQLKSATPGTAIDTICDALDDDLATNSSPAVIIPNVMSLKFRIASKKTNADSILWHTATYNAITLGAPVAIEITMTLLSERDYIKWAELKKVTSPLADDFLKQNQQSFTRIVFLGDRNKI